MVRDFERNLGSWHQLLSSAVGQAPPVSRVDARALCQNGLMIAIKLYRVALNSLSEKRLVSLRKNRAYELELTEIVRVNTVPEGYTDNSLHHFACYQTKERGSTA
jgi:hypothetical protein